MKFFPKLGRLFLGKKKSEPAGRQKRGYDAGDYNRLTADWFTSNGSANVEINRHLKTVTERSRDLERNDAYSERFYKMLLNNVLGADGIGLQMKIVEPDGQGGMKYDKVANDKIENAWYKWGRKENCSLDGSLSWNEGCRTALRSAARDGFFFARIAPGAPNDFGFALHWLESDCLDVNYSGTSPRTGNRVIMGCELEEKRVGKIKFFKVVAYWLYPQNPFEHFLGAPREVERVPAEEIIHPFIKTRIGQVTGFPWMAPVMRTFRDLGKYEEAELVAAREGACKGYYLEKTVTPEGYAGPVNEAGEALQPTEPGMGIDGVVGEKYVPINPTHPTDAFPYFVKTQLRKLSAGLGVSYNSLANDLEAVNFSSFKAGRLEEGEEWKGKQNWFIESFVAPVFEAWLPFAILSGQVALPMSKLEKFNKPDWKPRRWESVEPLKDLQADVLAVEKGFSSRRRIIAEKGGDIEEVFREQQEDNKLAELNELDFTPEETAIAEGEDESPAAELKAEFDAYGVGVRAGAITPTVEDEDHFRKKVGLPALPKSARDAWGQEHIPNTRRPITLTQLEGAPKPNQLYPETDPESEQLTPTPFSKWRRL